MEMWNDILCHAGESSLGYHVWKKPP
jgi:hypothetical protein